MKSWVWLLLAVFTCAVTLAYRQRILLPWEHYINVERGSLKAEMGDLYPRWVGTRELLLHGRNPYGPEVSHEIQTAFYGHAIEQTYNKPEAKILDEQRFAYPVYVVFLLAPTMDLDFAKVQKWAPVAFGIFVALSVWLWLRVLDWRISHLSTVALILIVLSTPQMLQGFRLHQIGLFVFFLLALASWCVVREHLFLAGVLLALSTIKPQTVVLCVVWFLLWTLGGWKNRWRLAGGFAAATIALVGAGELLLPRWPQYFLEGVEDYPKYFWTTSLTRLVLGNWIGGSLSIAAIGLLLAYAWSKRRVAAQSADFVELLSMFFVASALVLPLLIPFNQGLLLLPVFMLLRDWRTLPNYGRKAFVGLLAWPVIAASILLIHPPDTHSITRTPFLPSALILLTPFLVCVLMFLRREPPDLAKAE
ncbi:MAG TPA: glycosyltransferase family 87 protein [Candidatus Eisenbacteria bacterium]|nr:glycosyltransferase family 87 protein [Candidatus Eisenbacteria bacterium]